MRLEPVCVAMSYAGPADARAVMLKVQTDPRFGHRTGERIDEYYAFSKQKDEAFRWLEEPA